MRHLRPCLAAIALWSCSAPRSPSNVLPAPVDVTLDAGEARAALAILQARRTGQPVDDDAWQRLFRSAGYVRLQQREAAMRRPFTDSSFRDFMLSDTLLERAGELERAVASLSHLDVGASAARALAYLPAGTRLRARLYLEIKPRTNTFVFTGSDSTPSIFLYVDPHVTPAQLENTVSHELHHIGMGIACDDAPPTTLPAAPAMLLRFLGAFSEGRAMLAAAGSVDAHPHATDEDSVRTRWDRDVANAAADIAELSSFFRSVLDGRITDPDSVMRRAFVYYGPAQGPWYTVGWLMASTVERELGRDALVAPMCDETKLFEQYEAAARRANARGARLPLWDPDLVDRLLALRQR